MDKDDMVTIELELEEDVARELMKLRDSYGHIELDLPIGEHGEPVTVKILLEEIDDGHKK